MADKTYLQAASVDTLVHCLHAQIPCDFTFRPDGTVCLYTKGDWKRYDRDAVAAELLSRFAALEAERDRLREWQLEATKLAVDTAEVAQVLIRHNTHPDGDAAVRTFLAKYPEGLPTCATTEAPGHDNPT